jgi:hypothetical protein
MPIQQGCTARHERAIRVPVRGRVRVGKQGARVASRKSCAEPIEAHLPAALTRTPLPPAAAAVPMSASLSPTTAVRNLAAVGEQHARYATKSHGAIAAKHRASEGKIKLGALPLRAAPAHLAAIYALPTSTTATAVILSNVQDEPQSIRLATCLDRSAAASGAIASTVSPCLPWRKLLSLAEARRA